MSYIDRSLGVGERVILRAHFHWLYSLKAWLALLLLFWCLIGIYIFFAMMIRKWSTEIGVTTHRFILKQGLFNLRTQEMALNNIEGVEVSQNFLGQILNFGHVRVEGTGDDAIELPTIADPVGIRRAIETGKEIGK